MAIQVKWKIFEVIILTTFFFNVENWTKKVRWNNSIKMIYQVFNLSRTAPYSGVLKDSGSWPCWEFIN